MNHSIGDLLQNVQRGVILQQVNAQGRMGSGFAKAVFDLYPKVREVYHDLVLPNQADSGRRYLGTIHAIEVRKDLFVVNLVAQQFYGRDGRRYTSYDALDECLSKIASIGRAALPIHHPLIGADLGGGNWAVIKTIIEANLGFDTTLWTLS